MLRNRLPVLSKEYILDIQETPKDTVARLHRKHSAAKLTPWQIMPIPSYFIEPHWHQVYKGRHHFVEARGGIVLVTARLQAFYDWKASTRPSANRWLRREEVQDIRTDPCDEHGIALGMVARRGITHRRLPTRWRVWYNPTGYAHRSRPSRHPEGYGDDGDMSGWHRVYATTEAGYLYIETGYEHLKLRKHREALVGREGNERLQGSLGIIKIDKQSFVDWLTPDGETIVTE